MKEFLKSCLEDLESLTGIRQLYYLQTDTEGKRKIEVLINGMLSACKEFDYIPEAAQKSIISSQMIQDQTYEALNSRVIWKWLNAFKGPYLNPAKLQDEPVIFEPLKPETEKMVREWQMSLLDNPKPTNVDLEMAKIKAEDAARLAGLETKPKSLSVAYKPKAKDPREEKIRVYLAKKKGRDWIGARTFEMDGLVFRCDDDEDGYTTFVEALK